MIKRETILKVKLESRWSERGVFNDWTLSMLHLADLSSLPHLHFTSPRLFALLTAYTKSIVCLDMTFDDDTKLFGLMRRYSDLEEADELKRQVVEYVRTQIHDVNAEIEQFKTQSATQETTQAEG